MHNQLKETISAIELIYQIIPISNNSVNGFFALLFFTTRVVFLNSADIPQQTYTRTYVIISGGKENKNESTTIVYKLSGQINDNYYFSMDTTVPENIVPVKGSPINDDKLIWRKGFMTL